MADTQPTAQQLAEQHFGGHIFSVSLAQVLYFLLASNGLVSPDQMTRALSSKRKELTRTADEVSPEFQGWLDVAQQHLTVFIEQIAGWGAQDGFNIDLPRIVPPTA